MNKSTKAIAFSGIASAIIVILMFIAGIIDVLDYSACAICGIIITFMIVEFGGKYALGVYIASSVIALFILPTKSTCILFVLFCGWYPLVKRYIERTRPIVSYIVKLILFNAVLIAIIFVTMKLLMIKTETKAYMVFVFIIANISFILYDILITKLIYIYVNRFRKKIFKK